MDTSVAAASAAESSSASSVSAQPDATSSLETPAKRVKVLSPSIPVRPASVTPISSNPSNHSSDTCTAAATTTTTTTHTSPLSDLQIRSLLQQEAGYDFDKDIVTPKRTEYLSWDDYFMAVAQLSAQRSKDPKTPKGACIVDNDNRVVGIGYNGFPRGCSDDVLPWIAPHKKQTHRWLHTPAPYECHAEVNAILNKCSDSIDGARLYVADFPCNECAKIIVQSRIRQVVYLYDTNPDNETSRASRIMFAMAGVETRKYTPVVQSLTLDFTAEMDNDDDDDDDKVDKDEAATFTTTDPPPSKSGESPATRYRDMLVAEANFDPTTIPSTKRSKYLSWDDYFMAVAFLTAKRSKDPNTQVGACIVNKNKCIVGLGYNGFPRGCSDDHLPWARQTTPDVYLHKKYAYVCHAEVNAILNKCSADVKDATLYVALFPCNECAKVIIQAGIREVVYLSDRYHDAEPFRASRILLRMAGVKLRRHVPETKLVQIQLEL